MSFFLLPVSSFVREANLQRDGKGLTYASKAIIISFLARNANGRWDVELLTPQLQKFVRKHKLVFEASHDGSMA